MKETVSNVGSPAVSVRGLTKRYRIASGIEKHNTLGEMLLHKARNPMARAKFDEFEALSNISFDIQTGDVVGIIGRNGAGKSTLLKVLSQITEPTEGEIALYGRVGSLLEVGTGFHPELTGRENIFLNGSILGMSKGEIQNEFDNIVEFSGVSKFLDTPVKRYSSGMYVRLAFAVAAHLRTEILVVDEVLAVGDSEFQAKCLGKMKDVARDGRTVLFVSHHMQSVMVLCKKAIYLEKGKATMYNSVPDAIQRYVDSMALGQGEVSNPDTRPGTGEMRFVNFGPRKETWTCGEAKEVEFSFLKKRPMAGKVFVSFHIVDGSGVIIAQCDSRLTGNWFDADEDKTVRFSLDTPWLKPGSYRIDAFLCSSGVLDVFEDACRLHIIPLLPYPSAGNDEATANGLIFADYNYKVLSGSSSEVSEINSQNLVEQIPQ